MLASKGLINKNLIIIVFNSISILCDELSL